MNIEITIKSDNGEKETMNCNGFVLVGRHGQRGGTQMLRLGEYSWASVLYAVLSGAVDGAGVFPVDDLVEIYSEVIAEHKERLDKKKKKAGATDD